MPNPNGYDDAVWPNGEWLNCTTLGLLRLMFEIGISQTRHPKTLYLDSASIVGFDAANASTYTLAPGDYMIIARNGATNVLCCKFERFHDIV